MPEENLGAGTFSVDEENDVLAECFIEVPMHGQDLDDLVGQRSRLFIVHRIMR